MKSTLNTIKKKILGLHGTPLRTVMVVQYLVRHPGEIGKCIDEFIKEPECLGRLKHSQLSRKILKDMFKHLITPEEYFLYDFSDLSEDEKGQFVGDIERTIHCARMYNTSRSGRIFMDKLKTYELFEPFYQRDVVGIKSEEDREAFSCFAAKHPTFLVKPAEASRGYGIHSEAVNHNSIDEVFQRLLEMAPCVVEEFIKQADGMAKFHPRSVNTIRYATFLTNNGFETIACFVKIGRGNSIVDNGGAGGLLAAVNDNDGQIVTAGRSERDEVFEVHPDTGVQIKGAYIPQWEELKGLVAELVKVLPDQRYVGWDLALSTNGWVLVEGNSGGQFVGPQISLKKGLRPVVSRTFGEV